MALNPQAAYVGSSAFAHKAGLHVSAIAKRPDAYEHVPPDSVGNGTRFVVSELAGKSDAARSRPRSSASTLDGTAAQRRRRHAEADGARGLPLRGRRRVARAADAAGRPAGSRRGSRSSRSGDHRRRRPARRRRGCVSRPRRPSRCTSTASGSSRTAEGNGPVNALDTGAAQRASATAIPALDRCTSPTTRCGCSTPTRARAPSPGCWSTPPNGERRWTTIGVSENIIEASWQALVRLARLRLAPRLARPGRRAVRLTHAHRSFRCPRARRPPAPGDQPGAGRAPARGQCVEGRPTGRPRRRSAHRRFPRTSRAPTWGTRSPSRRVCVTRCSSHRTSTSPMRSR